ncbi:MAG: hypothetical protein IJV15_10430 [Lachnospiraceae bacterium]|nr:hypothetical protein [Lachnospiraceae bacterium]
MVENHNDRILKNSMVENHNDSLLKKKTNLKQLFTSDAWAANRLSRIVNGKRIERRILDVEFWDNVVYVVKIYEPLYQVLRLVDTEVVPTMPIVYELMRVMKDTVKQQRGSKWVLNIIQDRWDKMLNHPLHAAGKFYFGLFVIHN